MIKKFILRLLDAEQCAITIVEDGKPRVVWAFVSAERSQRWTLDDGATVCSETPITKKQACGFRRKIDEAVSVWKQ